MKSKDVADAFMEIGFEKKNSGATVDVEEFELFLNYITRSHQIKDIDAYTSGSVTIKSVSDKPAKAPASAEAKAGDKAKEEKPADDTPVSKAEIKAEPKAESKPAAKAEEKPEIKTQASKGNERPAYTERKPQTQQRRYDAPQGQRPPQNNQTRPQQKPSYPRYTERPQDDPFAKRRENMNRAADGRRPMQAQMQGQRPMQAKPALNNAQQQKPEIKTTPQNAQSPLRPAQQAQIEKQQRLAKQAQQQKPQQPQQKKEEKRAQKQQFKTITPTIDMSNVKGGVNIHTDYKAEAPKTRVVDMRTSDVNLSKYDERYNDQFYAIANGTDTKASKQKLKKQDNRGQNAKSTTTRTKI